MPCKESSSCNHRHLTLQYPDGNETIKLNRLKARCGRGQMQRTLCLTIRYEFSLQTPCNLYFHCFNRGYVTIQSQIGGDNKVFWKCSLYLKCFWITERLSIFFSFLFNLSVQGSRLKFSLFPFRFGRTRSHQWKLKLPFVLTRYRQLQKRLSLISANAFWCLRVKHTQHCMNHNH